MEDMEFQDITIECKLCHEEFIWCVGEQQFYHDHSLTQPNKCPACRAELKRKFRRQQEEEQARKVSHEG